MVATRARVAGLCAAVSFTVTGCGGDPDAAGYDVSEAAVDAGIPTPVVPQARAVFHDASGAEIGTASLTQEENSVRVVAELGSLEPGEHGFHIHEFGSCVPPSFDSAGDHFNPSNRAHGFNHPQGPHAGDLPNLTVAADGTARADHVNDLVTLAPGQPNSLLHGDGTSLVVHDEPDDYASQPSGEAGEMIACGVVTGV